MCECGRSQDKPTERGWEGCFCAGQKNRCCSYEKRETVLERIRNKRHASEVLLHCCFFFFFSFQDSYANKPLLAQWERRKGRSSGLPWRAPSLQASQHQDFLAVLRTTPTRTGASQPGWQGQRVAESDSVCV